MTRDLDDLPLHLLAGIHLGLRGVGFTFRPCVHFFFYFLNYSSGRMGSDRR